MTFKDHFKVSDHMPITDESPDRKRVWVNFIPNIDFGHLLTMIAFAGGMVGIYNNMDKRLTIVEEQNKQLISAMTDGRQVTRDTINSVQSDVRQIKEGLIQMQSDMRLTVYKLEQARPQGK